MKIIRKLCIMNSDSNLVEIKQAGTKQLYHGKESFPTYESGSKRRLEQLVRKLESNSIANKTRSYKSSLNMQGVIEPAPATKAETEFYITHKYIKAAVRRQVEALELRVGV